MYNAQVHGEPKKHTPTPRTMKGAEVLYQGGEEGGGCHYSNSKELAPCSSLHVFDDDAALSCFV